MPVLIEPEEVNLDLFACTHNHQDHTDPETIRGLRNKDTMLFLGPPPSCELYQREGIESGRTRMFWPKAEMEFRDLKLRGTFALPTDDSDLCHMGFLLQFGNGPKFYITGDTDYHELLFEAAKHRPIICLPASMAASTTSRIGRPRRWRKPSSRRRPSHAITICSAPIPPTQRTLRRR